MRDKIKGPSEGRIWIRFMALWIASCIGSGLPFKLEVPGCLLSGYYSPHLSSAPVGLYSLITPETPLLIDHSDLSGHRGADRKHRKRKL